MVYQDVTRNKNLSAAAKGLYAYLASFCGADDKCYPSVDMILSEMGMVKDTFYRHINALVAAGVVTKSQNVGKDGRFGKTVYRLTHAVEIHDFPNTKKQESDFNGFPLPKNRESSFSTAVKQETNNNNININSLNNNSIYSTTAKDRRTRKPNSFHNFQERDYDFTALQEQLVNQDAPHPDAAAGTGEEEHYEPR